MLLRLALASLRSRAVSTSLTVFSIALSILLLAGVDAVRNGARAGFAGTVSHVDLVAGARGGELPLLLSTVFHVGNASNSVSWQTYQHFAHHPAVAWTIPISTGDSFHGYRVIATDENLYAHYQYRGNHSLAFAQGHAPSALFDAALGANVATRLRLSVGDTLALAHGVEAHSILNHDNAPFHVAGVLERTATPIDDAVYITLLGEEAMHYGWTSGTPPAIGESLPPLDAAQLHVETVTAFLIGARSRISTLYLQRELNTYKPEPLTAIIPAYTLQELWALMNYADAALSLVSAAVLVVGLLSMLASLYTTLNERRREVAVLRAVGVHSTQVFTLFIAEAALIASAGVVAGMGVLYAALFVLHTRLEMWAGLSVVVTWPSRRVLLYAAATVLCAAVLGAVPAWRAYRNSLVDGLQAT